MKIKLKDIILDAGTQARASINPDTVTEYAERMTEGDVFPPVVLFHDGSEYYVGDGFHRILSAERLTFTDIDAEVRKGTAQDALWYALGANRTNGQRMTRGDTRHAVEVALKTWPDKTQQEIAEQVGCSQQYVGKVQNELTTSCKLDLPPTRTGKDGKQYPTTYNRKETPQEEKEEDEITDQEEEEETPPPKRGRPSMGMQYARIAIFNLERIAKNDTQREEAFNTVSEWIQERIVK